MNQERLNELKDDFQNALTRLEEALKEDVSKNAVALDGTIQRFEFTYELAWKLAKAVMEHGGKELNVTYPRMVIKEAYSCGVITAGDEWLDMLDDRNKTSHIYDEKQALGIYQKIKNNYVALFRDFNARIKKLIS